MKLGGMDEGAAGQRAARRGWLHRLRHRDHTRGALSISILALAVPSILTSLGAMGSFQLVELKLLGWMGPDAMAAAGATNQTLRQMILLMLLGLSAASQMLVAQLAGAGRIGDAEHIAGQTVLAGAALWLAVTLAGIFAAGPLVRLVTDDPAVIALGTPYVRVAFPFLATVIFMQLATAILGGAGDTTTPMLVNFLVTPLALFAQWALGFGHFGLPELGFTGIAWGQGLGGLVGTAVLLRVLFRGRARVHLRRRHLLPDSTALSALLRNAWQPTLHFVARSSIVIFFMALAGRIGGEAQAAYTIGLRVEMLAFMVAFPMANACATLVGQNLGAGSLPRAWRAIFVTCAMQLALLLPMALGIFLFRGELAAWFSDDPQVTALAAEYLFYSAIALCFYGPYFAAFRAMQAAGSMLPPMLIAVSVALLLGLPLGVWLSRGELGATGMWIASMVYALVNCALTIGWLLTGHWTRPHRRAQQR
ncbi:MAG: MATE family efflux transporter [Deltaproteobacteria bacterium]|nr:MATE family efflux transporter [Deltaproteobacteria bacterium]